MVVDQLVTAVLAVVFAGIVLRILEIDLGGVKIRELLFFAVVGLLAWVFGPMLLGFLLP